MRSHVEVTRGPIQPSAKCPRVRASERTSPQQPGLAPTQLRGRIHRSSHYLGVFPPFYLSVLHHTAPKNKDIVLHNPRAMSRTRRRAASQAMSHHVASTRTASRALFVFHDLDLLESPRQFFCGMSLALGFGRNTEATWVFVQGPMMLPCPVHGRVHLAPLVKVGSLPGFSAESSGPGPWK